MSSTCLTICFLEAGRTVNKVRGHADHALCWAKFARTLLFSQRVTYFITAWVYRVPSKLISQSLAFHTKLAWKKKGKVDSAGSDLAKMQIICKGVSLLKFCAAQAGGRVQCYAHTRGVLCTLFANFLPPQEKKKRQKNFAKGYILRARLSHTAVHISGKGFFFFFCAGGTSHAKIGLRTYMVTRFLRLRDLQNIFFPEKNERRRADEDKSGGEETRRRTWVETAQNRRVKIKSTKH